MWKRLRAVNVGVLAVVTAAVLLGSLYNSDGLKHSIARLPPAYHNISSSMVQCVKRVLVLNIPDSLLCCDEGRAQDLLCVASFDQLSRLLSHPVFAWILPLLPCCVTFLLDCWYLFTQRGDVGGGAGGGKKMSSLWSVSKATLKRLLFYSLLVCFRSVSQSSLILSPHSDDYTYTCVVCVVSAALPRLPARQRLSATQQRSDGRVVARGVLVQRTGQQDEVSRSCILLLSLHMFIH